jgi:predicted ATPase
MLTRLVVSGFKNLVDVDLSFGPFTCIAGANGVGKSNLLDAIGFLSALADRPLNEAALSVRDAGATSGDIRGLFHHAGDRFDETISFDAEMIIPETGFDDLGQEATAVSTFVRYGVTLRYRNDFMARNLGPLEMVREELSEIPRAESARHLPFHPPRSWLNGYLRSQGREEPYISTVGEPEARVIRTHRDGIYQDGISGGRMQSLRAASLPRTALSAANAAESPTATLVKRELQSWRLLQLEPSSLRAPAHFNDPVGLSSNGAHLPSTLYNLAHKFSAGPPDIYSGVANRVSDLIDDVRSIEVDRDEHRQLLTLLVTGRDGTKHAARALSDGTLRFLALAVLAVDRSTGGLICLEEPENGIHPERIPAMVRLLSDLTSDLREPVRMWNPIRQVIMNTHSPSVVMQVPEDSLVMAQTDEIGRDGQWFRALRLRCLEGTWREGVNGMKATSKGRLLGYLNPVGRSHEGDRAEKPRRVIDRDDMKKLRIPIEKIAG